MTITQVKKQLRHRRACIDDAITALEGYSKAPRTKRMSKAVKLRIAAGMRKSWARRNRG